MELTWEEKFDVLNGLCSHELCMRRPGNWYVSSGLNVGGDGFLTGEYGNGETPQQAILNHWDKYCVSLPADKFIIVDWAEETRRHVRWNGCRFVDVKQPLPKG